MAEPERSPLWYDFNTKRLLRKHVPFGKQLLKRASAKPTSPQSGLKPWANTKEELHRQRLDKLIKTKVNMEYQEYLSKVEAVNKRKEFIRKFGGMIDEPERRAMIDDIRKQ